MKSTLSHIVFLLFMLCLAHIPVLAQESPDYEHVNGYDDKSEHEIAPEFYTEPDGKAVTTNPRTQPVRDSIGSKMPVNRIKPGLEPVKDGKGTENKQQQGQQSGAEDDSILSFNFLYYIMQKFKLQDIIE
jgi:hypothetical protein